MRNRSKDGLIILLPLLTIIVVFILFDLINLFQYSFPYELREGANIELTKLFLQGKNPYSLDVALGSENPSLFYMYPFAYSLITAGLSYIFPFIDLKLLHYLVSFACGVGTSVVGAIIIRKQSVSGFAPIMAFFLLLCCSWRGSYISAFPDSMALLISVIMLYLVMYGVQDYTIPLLSFLTILLFYTKQYFIVIAVSIWIYYLITNRKKMLQYTAYCALIGIISVLIVSLVFPLYWTYSLFFVSGSTTRVSIENIRFCIGQYFYIGAAFFPVLVMCIFGLVKKITKCKNQVDRSENLILYIHFMIAGLSLLKFGINDGAYLTYFLQLLVPTMVILGILCFEQYVYVNIVSIEKGARVIICFLFVGVSVLNITQKFSNYIYLKKDNVRIWDEVYSVLDQYDKDQVYYSPNLSFYAMDHNQYVYDYGQNEFVDYESEGVTTLDTWSQSKLNQFLFPYADDIIKKHTDYQSRLLKDVQDGVYDVVVETQYLYFEREDLIKQYDLLGTYELKSGTMTYWTDLWVKKSITRSDLIYIKPISALHK